MLGARTNALSGSHPSPCRISLLTLSLSSATPQAPTGPPHSLPCTGPSTWDSHVPCMLRSRHPHIAAHTSFSLCDKRPPKYQQRRRPRDKAVPVPAAFSRESSTGNPHHSQVAELLVTLRVSLLTVCMTVGRKTRSTAEPFAMIWGKFQNGHLRNQ